MVDSGDMFSAGTTFGDSSGTLCLGSLALLLRR
jgi:hypothetical protein